METGKEFSFKTYTFVIYFKEVLCISQVRGITLNQAIEAWKNNEMFKLRQKLRLSQYEYTVVKQKVLYDYPTLLNGISNCWCGDCAIKGNHFSLTIVLTNPNRTDL